MTVASGFRASLGRAYQSACGSSSPDLQMAPGGSPCAARRGNSVGSGGVPPRALMKRGGPMRADLAKLPFVSVLAARPPLSPSTLKSAVHRRCPKARLGRLTRRATDLKIEDSPNSHKAAVQGGIPQRFVSSVCGETATALTRRFEEPSRLQTESGQSVGRSGLRTSKHLLSACANAQLLVHGPSLVGAAPSGPTIPETSLRQRLFVPGPV